MKRHTAVPIALLVSSVFAVSAVFAVHKIEATVGPVSQPYATQFFSPGSPIATSKATIRFTARGKKRVTITIRSCKRKPVIRTLLTNKLISGAYETTWDGKDNSGKVARDGCYQIDIRLKRHMRVYHPARPTWIDTKPPIAQVDRSAIRNGWWKGLILTEAGVHIDYRAEPNGKVLDDKKLKAKIYKARVGHSSGEPKFIPWPMGSTAYRFEVSVKKHPRLYMTAVDLAGNETPLPNDLIDRAEVIK